VRTRLAGKRVYAQAREKKEVDARKRVGPIYAASLASCAASAVQLCALACIFQGVIVRDNIFGETQICDWHTNDNRTFKSVHDF
jgi:hypothetical protein